MIVLFWVFVVAFGATGGLLAWVAIGAVQEARREEVPEDELDPRERRGAWSRMMCRNRRTNRLGRWAQINKVLR